MFIVACLAEDGTEYLAYNNTHKDFYWTKPVSSAFIFADEEDLNNNVENDIVEEIKTNKNISFIYSLESNAI